MNLFPQIVFPREKNGFVDDGTVLNDGPCPNCHATTYFEFLSVELCFSCGMVCDYWYGGANDTYDAMVCENTTRAILAGHERP